MSTEKQKFNPRMIAALIVAVIFALMLCLIIGIKLCIPSHLGQVLGDPCGRYAKDLLFGSFICAPVFIAIAFAFRKLNKILLTAILAPSALFGIYLIASGMMADNNISAYGYLAKSCYIPGINAPKNYNLNP